MPFDYQAAAALRLVASPAIPFIKGWNRLEGRPRTADFERALRAEVRDALWFLTRQWQFGELKGEDAASPVEIRTLVEAAPFIRYAPGAGSAVPYQRDVPLETRAESEAIPPDLTLHVQVTRHFFGLLAGQSRLSIIRGLYLAPAAYGLTEAALAGYLDADGRQVLSLARSRILDGARLLADIAGSAHDPHVDGLGGLTPAERTALKQAGADLLRWFRRLYHASEPPGGTAWVPRFLEYQFECTTRGPGAHETTLVADEYVGGQLEWFGFDLEAPTPTPGPAPAGPTPGSATEEHALSFLPAPVSFGGMPSHRYWEFEDRTTEFADLDANTTDVAKLLLTEFALVYSNDWCVIPYVLDVGSLCVLPGLLVTDDFGETTLVRAAGRGLNDTWQRWAMFTLGATQRGHPADQRLLLAPVLAKSMEGPNLERILLLRDEMANMVWAVEKTVPTVMGSGADGYAVTRAASAPPSAPPLHPTTAAARYALGTDVPRNWHPFIPVHVDGSARSVQLQRAQMPGPPREIHGRVIAGPSPYYINEEEVPRAGKTVTRAFQRARWLGGSTFLWIGRRVTTGRGEGGSGLAFDLVVDLPPIGE